MPTGVALPKKRKNVVDTRARRQKMAGNEPDAKAILPEPRSVQKAISYQIMLKHILAAAVLGVAATVANAATVVTFTVNGLFEVPANVTSLEYLVVGGGGGGGGQSGGGGGGGEFLTGLFSVTPGESFTITIGLGGGVNGNNTGSNGGASSLISLTTANDVTANGGGGGGAILNSGRGNGGSGTGSAGGNGWKSATPFPPGVAGGNGGSGGQYGGGDVAGGGGGGAGGNGGNGSGGTVGGNGGVGLSSSISGVLTYYAGGGGGATQNNVTSGLGGLGGGGKGGYAWGSNPAVQGATAGAPNTGGGGGGADDGPGIGGSGIVILSYDPLPDTGLFQITSVSYDANNDQLTLTWISAPGATYTIENATQFVGNGAGTSWDNLTTGILSGGTTTTKVIDAPSPGTYYRIRKE